MVLQMGVKGSSFNVPLLMYHHLVAGDQADERFYEVSINQFERQLDCLTRWSTISFAKLLDALSGNGRLPPRPVVITFDDAFRSFVELGLPALQKRKMQATMFVPAGHLGGTNVWDEARGFPRRPIMTAAEIGLIAAAGVEIGSHGWLHRNLKLADEAEAEEELTWSKETLEKITRRKVHLFAYPYGEYRPANFRQLREAGYEAAVSIFSNERSVTSNPYAMRRVYVHEGDTPLRFRCKLSRPYLHLLAWRGFPKQQIASAI